MVLSAQAFQRQHDGESLVAFIRRLPLVEAKELDLERDPNLTRELEL
ncbi:hypothetical protein KBZ20_17425 [Vulcanococcus limneticus Candia 3F8]|nr:hypothetical protein [Vulcanococcus limneticus]MCP9793530.1 hypothetical protein [Vulcanococcus limneticus MW73D5]MCP9895544.1 hypothetical protein [Vulcanococcus limneticus Candia 3F8]MCP9898958.1 hypothetical protein [Vulcanococcus limneticus Candia 3B3]